MANHPAAINCPWLVQNITPAPGDGPCADREAVNLSQYIGPTAGNATTTDTDGWLHYYAPGECKSASPARSMWPGPKTAEIDWRSIGAMRYG